MPLDLNKNREFARDELAYHMGRCLRYANIQYEDVREIVDEFIIDNFPLDEAQDTWRWKASLNRGFDSVTPNSASKLGREPGLFTLISKCYSATAHLQAVTCAMGSTTEEDLCFFVDALGSIFHEFVCPLSDADRMYLRGVYKQDFESRLKYWNDLFQTDNPAPTEVCAEKTMANGMPETCVRNEDVRLIADSVTCVVNKLRSDAIANKLSEDQWTSLLQSVVNHLKGFRVQFGTVVPPEGV